MGVGESYWLKNKVPVKLHDFHTGGIFTPSGWYFEAPGLHQRFHLSSGQMKKLMFKHKAYLIVDKEEVEKLIAKYRGEKPEKKVDPRAAQQKAIAKQQEAAKKAEEEKRKRQEEAMKKREEYEKQRALFEQKKKAAEEQRRQLESAKKAAAEAKKAA